MGRPKTHTTHFRVLYQSSRLTADVHCYGEASVDAERQDGDIVERIASYILARDVTWPAKADFFLIVRDGGNPYLESDLCGKIGEETITSHTVA